jgi:hypothetical protein
MAASPPSDLEVAGQVGPARPELPEQRIAGWPNVTSANAGTRVRTFWALAVVLALHAGLGVAAYGSSAVATAHGLATVLGGVYIGLTGTSGRVLAAVAYIAGAETLWRMASANLLWETGKYAVVLTLVLAGLRGRRAQTGGLAAAYLFLLLPGVLLTFAEHGIFQSRAAVSFNFSGPLTIAVGLWAVPRLRITRGAVHRALLAGMVPAFATAVFAIVTTVTRGAVTFSATSSNFVTSGGYGPNQVSSALSFGALTALIVLVAGKRSRSTRLLLLGVVVICAAWSVMTFSRGGIYDLGVAAVLALPGAFRSQRLRRQVLSATIALVAVATFVVFPRMNAYTEGTLEARFTSTSTTGRVDILNEDIDIFKKHPVLGAGVGGSRHERAQRGAMAAHTEYTRLLAEHGILGLAALGILAFVAVRTWLRASSGIHRATAGALLGWAFAYMLHNALRTAVPAVAIALAVHPDLDRGDRSHS